MLTNKSKEKDLIAHLTKLKLKNYKDIVNIYKFTHEPR